MSIIISIQSSKSKIYFGIGGEVYPRFTADKFEIDFVTKLLPFSNKSRLVVIAEGVLLSNEFKREISSLLIQKRYTVKWLDSSFLATFAAGLKTGLVLDLSQSTIVPVYDWTVLYYSSVFDIDGDLGLEGKIDVSGLCNAIKKCLQKCPLDTRSELAKNILIPGKEMVLDDVKCLQLKLNESIDGNAASNSTEEDATVEISTVDLNASDNASRSLQYCVFKTCYNPRLIAWTGASLLADVKGLSIGTECRTLGDLQSWTYPVFEE